MADRRRNAIVLQEIQPGLLGLMDGSVSTLAPIFAAAGLTGEPLSAFFVGLAASLGAAISMGLSEALSDDGSMTGAWWSASPRHDHWRRHRSWGHAPYFSLPHSESRHRTEARLRGRGV